jgi:hypothetical protein
MAYYLVRAKPKAERLRELSRQLQCKAFVGLRPFGNALTHSLENARSESDGRAIWEEEYYCSPPLAEERAAVYVNFVWKENAVVIWAVLGHDGLRTLDQTLRY